MLTESEAPVLGHEASEALSLECSCVSEAGGVTKGVIEFSVPPKLLSASRVQPSLTSFTLQPRVWGPVPTCSPGLGARTVSCLRVTHGVTGSEKVTG